MEALGFCMLLPGPEAMQMATYAGWKLRGTCGGIVSGLLFVLPGALIVLILSIGYVTLGELPLVAAGFVGMKAMVIVIVISALLKISRRILHRMEYRALAVCSFAGIFFFDLPFPFIILVATAYGLMHRTDPPLEQGPPVQRPAAVFTIRTILTVDADMVDTPAPPVDRRATRTHYWISGSFFPGLQW